MYNKVEAPGINACMGEHRERSNEEGDTVAQPICVLGGCNNKG